LKRNPHSSSANPAAQRLVSWPVLVPIGPNWASCL
jgi:hypothetical protein